MGEFEFSDYNSGKVDHKYGIITNATFRADDCELDCMLNLRTQTVLCIDSIPMWGKLSQERVIIDGFIYPLEMTAAGEFRFEIANREVGLEQI